MARVKEKADDTGKRRRWGCIAIICGVVALVVIVVAVLAYIVLHKIPETPKERFFNPALDGYVEVELSQHDFGLQSALHRIVSTFNQRHPNEDPASVDQIHGVIDFLLYRRIYCFFDSDSQTQTRRFLIVMNFKRLGPVIHFFTRKALKDLQQRTGRTMTFLKCPIFQTQGGRYFYAFTRSSLLLSNNIEILKQGILQQDKIDQRKWHASTAFQRFLNQTPQRGIAHGFLINTDNWLEQLLGNVKTKLGESEDLANLSAQLQQANVFTDQIDGFQVIVELESFEALKATVSFECVEASAADRLASLLYDSLLPSLKRQVEKDVRLETEVKRQDKVVVVTINIRGMEKFLDQLAGQIEP